MAFNLDNIKLNVFDFDVYSISTNSIWIFSIFCRKSVTAHERDDESSEDGHVESSRDDDSSDAVDEKESGGKNDGAVDTTTAKHYLPRESIICCNYANPIGSSVVL